MGRFSYLCGRRFALYGGGALMIAYGANPLVAAVTMLKVNVMAGIAVLPIAAVIAWVCGKFSTFVGGLHAK
jgi:hypothetical protein